MHYPGHDNWQGMSYGLLDETPVLSRTPSNPTIGDYLTEFQDRNRAWRESLKFPEFTPNSSGRLDPEEEVEDPEDDPILGPVVRKRNPHHHDGDSQVPDQLGPYGHADGSLDLIGPAAGVGSFLGFLGGLPAGGGLLGGIVGANMEKANAQARAMRSFGIPGSFSATKALDAYRAGMFGPPGGRSTVGQFEDLAMEMANAPDGGMFSDEDAKDPTAAFTMADLEAMQNDAGRTRFEQSFDYGKDFDFNTRFGGFDPHSAIRDVLYGYEPPLGMIGPNNASIKEAIEEAEAAEAGRDYSSFSDPFGDMNDAMDAAGGGWDEGYT